MIRFLLVTINISLLYFRASECAEIHQFVPVMFPECRAHPCHASRAHASWRHVRVDHRCHRRRIPKVYIMSGHYFYSGNALTISLCLLYFAHVNYCGGPSSELIVNFRLLIGTVS